MIRDPAKTQLKATWAVTMFSLTNELLAGRKRAMDLIHDVLDIGVSSHIEVDGFQGFSTFPKVSPHEAHRFRTLMDQRSATPAILGVYADPGTRRGGVFAAEETAEFIAAQIRSASALGFTIARIAFGVDTAVLKLLLPELESTQIRLLQEVQATVGPETHPFLEQLRALDDIDSPQLGLLLDTSTSMPALPISYLRQLRRLGIPSWLVQALETEWQEHGAQSLRPDIYKLIPALSPQAASLLMMPLLRFGNTPIEQWDQLLPRFAAIHLKYWDLEDKDQRVSSPVSHLLGSLRSIRYSGHLVSEWGGHEWCEVEDVKGVEMIRQHHDLCRKYLSADCIEPRAVLSNRPRVEA